MSNLDMTQAHKKTVSSIIDMVKEIDFRSKGGMCRKYKIVFTDGYEAEYCPLIGKFDKEQVAAGKELTFKIIHRGRHGDEIEPYYLPSSLATSSAPRQNATNGVPVNMFGHPGNLALGHAIQLIGATGDKKTLSEIKENLDEVFSLADDIEEYLLRKANPSF